MPCPASATYSSSWVITETNNEMITAAMISCRIFFADQVLVKQKKVTSIKPDDTWQIADTGIGRRKRNEVEGVCCLGQWPKLCRLPKSNKPASSRYAGKLRLIFSF
jgi:hypothetical protein